MKPLHAIRLENLSILANEYGGCKELASYLGYSQPTYLYQLLNRTAVQNGKPKNMGNRMARKIEQALDKPEGWMDERHKPEVEQPSFVDDDEVAIPIYDEVVFGEDYEQAQESIQAYQNGLKLGLSMIKLPRASLIECGANIEQSVCVRTTGDSMVPYIPDGTVMAIDKSRNDIKDGALHAVYHGGMLWIKVLHRMGFGMVKMHSYNPSHEDKTVDISSIKIIGRVFWMSIWHRM